MPFRMQSLQMIIKLSDWPQCRGGEDQNGFALPVSPYRNAYYGSKVCLRLDLYCPSYKGCVSLIIYQLEYARHNFYDNSLPDPL